MPPGRPWAPAAPRNLRRGDDVTATGPGEPVDPAAPDDVPFTRSQARRLAISTAIFSFATAISRVLGLIREVVAKNYFGVEGKINAFQIAFLVPNTVRALVADTAISSAFVPVFSDLLEKGERKRAWRVASSLLWLMLLGLGAITAFFILLAPLIMNPLYPQNQDLVVGLSRLLFPIVTLLGASGIIVGILNSYDEFSIPALAPVAWNLAIILGLVLGVPHASTEDGKLYIYAASILVGTVIQVLLPVPWLRGRGGRLELVIDWRDPAVRQVLKLMLPVALGLGLINFNALVDGVIAANRIDADLAPSAIDAAFRIYMLPQGVFSVAVATVLFPSMARFASRGDMAGFRSTVSLGVRQIVFLLAPASVVVAVLATPLTRLIYQRGEFHADQTPVVAGALAAFALGLTFNGTMLMLNRAFFSLQSNWIPTLVALGNLGVNLVLDLLFAPLGVWGIPLATSIVNIAGTAALLVLLRHRVGRIDFGQIASSSWRIVVAAGIAGFIAFGIWDGADAIAGRSPLGQIASLALGLGLAAAGYIACCLALQVRELDTLRSLSGRFRRA